MHCSRCGSENPVNARFCSQCGVRLDALRSSEGLQERAPIDYTPRHLAERILAARATLGGRGGGERKLITAMFADIAGSTALIQHLDPEDARHLIDPLLVLMMEAVHHYEGYVAKSLGDGILALFGAPISHEDHPQRAILAALRMQDAMRRHGNSIAPESGSRLRIRVGVHTGEVLMRAVRTENLQADYDPVGHTIHLASRLEGLAVPGSIVISGTTQRLVEGYFDVSAMGAVPVKGIDEPVTLFEVRGPGALQTRLQVAASRGLARFVGRQTEIESLCEALERALAGHGQLVAVAGEPGVGKSRLFHEFKRRCDRGCRFLETFSVSHGKAFAYLPLIELLKHFFALAAQDDERQRRLKVTEGVRALDRRLEDILPYLFQLLGAGDPNVSLPQMDPGLGRHRTFDALRRLLLAASVRQPLVLIFEDLQWLDTETAAFLDFLVAGLGDARILLLVNYRPEYRHHWPEGACFRQLRLDALDQGETETLLSEQLGDDDSLAPLRPRIAQQAEGNPFFLEELIRTLADQQLIGGGPGRYRLLRLPESLQIPDTVRGVLNARIDRLPLPAKALLQTLAVIGKEFTWSLVRRVLDNVEDDLRRLLFQLETGGFIYERLAYPELAYGFRHALIQEAAYDTLPREQRGRLHETTAEAMEMLFADQREERSAELAYHFRCGNNLAKAIQYLTLAGDRAARQCAVAEAVEQLTTALELLKQLADTPQRARQELAIRLRLGPVWMASRGYAAAEVETTYRRAAQLCDQVGRMPELFSALFGRYAYHLVRCDLMAAYALAEQLLALAKESGEADQQLLARCLTGESLFFLGNLSQARQQLQQAVAGYDSGRHRRLTLNFGLDPGVHALGYLTLITELENEPAATGFPPDAALVLAERQAHPTSLALALSLAALRQQLRGEATEVRNLAEAAVTLSTERGFSFWAAFSNVLFGWALACLGEIDDGLWALRRGLDAYRITGARLCLSHFFGLLAEAQLRAGRVAEALESIDEALGVSRRTAERYYMAELHRLRGEALLAGDAGFGDDRQRQAARSFRRAIAVARRQGAGLLMWRALLSRARLQNLQGHRDAARRTLQTIIRASGRAVETGDTLAARTLLADIDRQA
ncbi:adenylate cyclase [Marinobacterium nitratireducens]|uniref:Adenylate cyclase n=1 Tax=Marinobacterium nitratireducens TaxID=518897 RepID=A0A917ZMX9_9GAMM|nr:adenylate/guanylate cyclase domain-containing protein [Marinobacterium nitratireducens]GGO85310.1 adenylate cyclase [Marinobacterium nitratireducens]